MLTPDEGHLDRRIAQEAATLANLGWRVDIHSAVDPGLDYDADLARGVRLLRIPRPPTIPARRLGFLRPLKRVISRASGRLARMIEATQYRTRSIAGEITSANLSHLLSGEPYDLIFAHDVPVMPLGTALKSSWGVPLISDLHEVFPEQDEFFTSETARRYWRSLEADGLASSDAIICVNDAVADYVASAHGSPAPVAVVHNSVPFVSPLDLNPVGGIRSMYPIPPGARVMLFAGSLRPHKGLEVLVEGFAATGLDDWVLALLGEGPLRARIDSLVRGLGLSGRVFVGARAQQRELIQIASTSDLALLPYGAYGFNHLIATPNKLFEYVQARLPIATSRLPMVERIVAPLGNAGFVDFSDPPGIARGLANFVRHTLPTITPAKLETAAERLCWEAEEPALLNLVDRVMF